MTVEEKILAKARELFDVAAPSRLKDGRVLLVVGLESTPERDLDEFGHKADRFMMYGFKKHAAGRLERLINYIHKKGFSAELTGRYGYPHDEGINLKDEAVRAGLGRRGKSTVILHPDYGPRLRFMGMVTSAPLVKGPFQESRETPNPVCHQCNICIEVCPVKVLKAYKMTKPELCLSNITLIRKDGHSILCDKCVTLCPAGATGQPQAPVREEPESAD